MYVPYLVKFANWPNVSAAYYVLNDLNDCISDATDNYFNIVFSFRKKFEISLFTQTLYQNYYLNYFLFTIRQCVYRRNRERSICILPGSAK